MGAESHQATEWGNRCWLPASVCELIRFWPGAGQVGNDKKKCVAVPTGLSLQSNLIPSPSSPSSRSPQSEAIFCQFMKMSLMV